MLEKLILILALLLLLLLATEVGAQTRQLTDTPSVTWDFSVGGQAKANVTRSEIRRYPAAGCEGTTATSIWDLKAASPAVAACVAGSNILKGVLNYADSGNLAAEMHDILPADWTTTGGVDFRIYWSSTGNTGNARWVIQVVCTALGATATDDPAYPTVGNNGFNAVTTAVPGTANRLQTSTITGITLPASCPTVTNLLIHIKVSSDGQDGSDTQTGTKSLIFAELAYRRL